jgi:hypothetical protein
MSEGKRSKLSFTQRSEIWSSRKSGQSLHQIGRAFGKPHSCLRCALLSCGGIAPAARRRSRLALTLAEREDISQGIASGSSLRAIARFSDGSSWLCEGTSMRRKASLPFRVLDTLSNCVDPVLAADGKCHRLFQTKLE